jgi:hypothetical protein
MKTNDKICNKCRKKYDPKGARYGGLFCPKQVADGNRIQIIDVVELLPLKEPPAWCPFVLEHLLTEKKNVE